MTETTRAAVPALDTFIARAGGEGSVSGQALRRAGLPDRHVEAWRYTPLRAIASIAWSDAPGLTEADTDAFLKAASLPQGGSRIVFGNGRAVVTALPASTLPLDASAPGTADPAGTNTRPFAAILNEALAATGLCLRVPAGQDAGVLTLASVTKGDGFSTHNRHRIVLDEKARLTLYEFHTGEGAYLTNPSLEIDLAPGAQLRHIKVQKDSTSATHLAFVTVRVASDARYEGFTLNAGGHLARHEIVSTLTDSRAEVHVNGVQCVDGHRLSDLTSFIHHAAPDCISRQTVKTVLSEQGQGVFQGKILVDRVAQRTNGYQMNQALLLSEKAQISSKPELEIYADDVKCSHGATVGALDEEQLFYLRSRGIEGAAARNILVQAFLLDALELVEKDDLRDVLKRSLVL